MSDSASPTEPETPTLPSIGDLPGLDSPLSALEGGPGLVYNRLIALKRAVRPLDKHGTFRGTSKSGKLITYKFRGVDDIYNHVHELMGTFGLVFVPETTDVQRAAYAGSGGGRSNHVAVMVTYRWYAEDGSSIPVQIPGEGMDVGDKGTGKALSMANKYAIIQSLSLPTGEPDSDDFQTEGTPAESAGVAPSGPHTRPTPGVEAVSGGNPSPSAPLADNARVPFTDAEEGRATIRALVSPTEQAGLRRRIFDTVNAGRITGGEANELMSLLDEQAKGRST